MKIIIYALRLPVAIVGFVGMALFIPFAGIVFFPAGLLWVLSTTSLAWWPIAKVLFPSIGDDFNDMSTKTRVWFALIPVVTPFIFGYGILVHGTFDMDFPIKGGVK